MCSTQIWLDRLEDIWIDVPVSYESLLAHVGFFLRSFGIVFHLVAELKTPSLVGSYGVDSLRWSVGNVYMVHFIWMAELKFGIFTIDTRV